MNDTTLRAALRRAHPGELRELDDGRCVIIGGRAASRTLTLEIGDDNVRIGVSRIVHAESLDDEEDVARVLRVVTLLRDGRAEELYGSTDTGVVGFIGYRIRDPEGDVERLDEGAVIVHTAPL